LYVSRYDKLFCTDLRELLAGWFQKNPESELEVIIFELYYIVRDLWEDVQQCASQEVHLTYSESCCTLVPGSNSYARRFGYTLL